MRVVVVGGGLLGLASARLIARERPQVDVVVLEKEHRVAWHQSGHNSGVAHAGLYYEPGSLRARLCRRGVELLKPFCAEHSIPYEECGKVVVALDESELPRLEEIHARALANGVPRVEMIDAARLREIEPHAVGIAALHSPVTAILDYRKVCSALAAEVVNRGGEVRLGASVRRVCDDGASPSVELADGSTLRADRMLVCAGLHADRLARTSGQPAGPRIIPFRGEYYALTPHRRDLCRGLIYPVPDPGLPFLGIHLTRRIDGEVLVGPNAVLALAREGYGWGSVNRADVGDIVRWPGMWRLAARHWRVGLSEVAQSVSRGRFVHFARRYVPELDVGDLVPAPAGVRAQAVDRSGALVDDFRIGEGRNVVWVRNAPSPAATSSLAIAETLVERLGLNRVGRSPSSL